MIFFFSEINTTRLAARSRKEKTKHRLNARIRVVLTDPDPYVKKFGSRSAFKKKAESQISKLPEFPEY